LKWLTRIDAFAGYVCFALQRLKLRIVDVVYRRLLDGFHPGNRLSWLYAWKTQAWRTLLMKP
jgi:hypothetical protein